MATSPARPSSPVEENTPQENNEWKENFISPGDFMRFFFIHAVLPVISFAAAIGKLTHFCHDPFFGLFQSIKCTYLLSFSSYFFQLGHIFS